MSISLVPFHPTGASDNAEPRHLHHHSAEDTDANLHSFLQTITEGIETREFRLVPVSEGLGGSYFIVGPKNRHLALFKPARQEVGMPENPKGNNDTEKIGFPPGQGYLREIAAYRLDHEHFAKVPMTGVVTLFGDVGSVQQFVHCDGDGAFGFAKYKTEDVHRIGLLDVRLLNCDRHEGNLLHVRDRDCDDRQNCNVYPIDHGYILPEGAGLQDLEFDWLYYTQSKVPFSKATLEYIAKLDATADARILRMMGFSEDVTDNVRAATMCLQIAALKKGKTLREIGDFVRRSQLTQPSGLESAMAAARRDMDSPEGAGSVDWEKLQGLLEDALEASSFEG